MRTFKNYALQNETQFFFVTVTVLCTTLMNVLTSVLKHQHDN